MTIDRIPREHDARLNRYTPGLFAAAKKVYEIAGEFDCDKYVTESRDGLRITIERVRKNVVEVTINRHNLN